MIKVLLVVFALTPIVHAAPHEKMEDKARTVKGGASLGVKACHADIERWCKTVKPGEGRIGACLKAKSKKLSKSCRRWASHGGANAMDEALTRDIDGPPQVSTAAPANIDKQSP